MFLDNLSANVLYLCDFRHLTYERGAEQFKIDDIFDGVTAFTISEPQQIILHQFTLFWFHCQRQDGTNDRYP